MPAVVEASLHVERVEPVVRILSHELPVLAVPPGDLAGVEYVHRRLLREHLRPPHEVLVLLVRAAVLEVRPRVMHDVDVGGDVLPDAVVLVLVRVAATAALPGVLEDELHVGGLPHRLEEPLHLRLIRVVVAVVVPSHDRAPDAAHEKLPLIVGHDRPGHRVDQLVRPPAVLRVLGSIEVPRGHECLHQHLLGLISPVVILVQRFQELVTLPPHGLEVPRGERPRLLLLLGRRRRSRRVAAPAEDLVRPVAGARRVLSRPDLDLALLHAQLVHAREGQEE
mmetsp:Transcript_23218/g.51839  ORF Transcript_23218/g.51839 Transcript_23218/m.51839 type:complete len:280 (-) Transcript_23218:221-1060(-)